MTMKTSSRDKVSARMNIRNSQAICSCHFHVQVVGLPVFEVTPILYDERVLHPEIEK